MPEPINMPINIGATIAAEAIEWIDTPFRWQGRVKGVGCDCKGLVAGVAAACGRPEAESLQALAGDYSRLVDAGRLRRGLAELFDRAKEIEEGDVLLLLIDGKAQHLGIALSGSEMVHCYEIGPRRVIRAAIGRGRLDSVWRWKEESSLVDRANVRLSASMPPVSGAQVRA